MVSFVGRNFRIMLQCQSNVIETVQQAMPDKFVDGKLGAKILDRRGLRISPDQQYLVVVDLLRAPHQRCHFFVAQAHRQETVLCAVVGKDVCE